MMVTEKMKYEIYLVAKLEEVIDSDRCSSIRDKLESMGEVICAKEGLGFDGVYILIIVKTNTLIDDIARRIRNIPGIATVDTIRGKALSTS